MRLILPLELFMGKAKLGDISNNIYNILVALDSDQRKKVVNAALTLCGDDGIDTGTQGEAQDGSKKNESTLSAKDYFSKKDPKK